MKNYLLKPHRRIQICNGNYWIVSKSNRSTSILDELWRFIKDKYFLTIHLKYDSNHLLSSFKFKKNQTNTEKSYKDQLKEQVRQFVIESDICLGILPKKGNASIRSMLKVYKQEDIYDRYMNGSNPKQQSAEL